MSFGAISKSAVQTLSSGARKAGIWLNTGEGGLSPHHLEGGCDVVFQIGTGKYSVRDSTGALSDEKLRKVAAHDQIKMFELKMSQGAKPGKGIILTGAKVTTEIAQIRAIPLGEDSISPNGHEDLKSVADLLDLIARIREVTQKPVGIKLVIGQLSFFEDFFTLINAHDVISAPDFITFDSAGGGTGAAPRNP
jgi:glutamate synthase domain-containing protein 2